MFKFWTTSFALLAVFALAACGGGGGNADQATQEAQVETPAETTESAPVETATGAEAVSVTLEGSLGCGHCNHQIGTGCSAAVQTADGKVYILQDMAAGSEPFDQRDAQKQIRVTGTVAEIDGVAYVKVSAYELL